ncbi:MAG: dihydrolipoyl dehydrogenase [Dehalococcoidia bacterium]|nr:dihydrolipoyl dehydrogenase [Dehalococcoidia bacterium]
MSSSCDLAIIGSGPGGCAAALTAARRGAAVSLIERETWGGVCLNVGCIPTKALVAVAHFIRRLQRADRLGVTVRGYDLDFPAMLARNARIIGTLRTGLADLLQREGVTLVPGRAAFESPTRLRVSHERQSRTLEASRTIIAAGARPVAGAWTVDEKQVCSYRGLLAQAALPARLLVIGGGVIGCEFASCFSAFGTRVTLIEQQAQVLPGEDPDAVRWLARALQAQGVTVRTGTTVQTLGRTSSGVAATLSDGERIEADRCLVAVGIRPSLEGLELPAAGIDAGVGITVDALGRTSQPNVAAIGDCLERHGLAHWASAEGVAAARALLNDAAEPVDAAAVPRCVFTDPEIASVGRTELGEDVHVSRFSFGALGKSHCDEEAEGFVKLVVDKRTDRVVGATIVGHQASSLIHYAVLAIRQQLTARQLAQTVTAHPTLPEGVTEAAASIYGESLATAARGGLRAGAPSARAPHAA